MAFHPQDVASFLLTGLAKAITEKGHATLALSGGSSPLPIFAILAKTDFAWDKVTITLVDERNVDPTHPDSNQKLVTDHVLAGKPSQATFIPLYNNQPAYHEMTSCDSMLLGMGTDGHFASLFPDMIGSSAFDVTQPPAIITTAPQGSPRHPRISMNLSLIKASSHVCLILPNAEKQDLFESAKTNPELPVHYLNHALGDALTLFS